MRTSIVRERWSPRSTQKLKLRLDKFAPSLHVLQIAKALPLQKPESRLMYYDFSLDGGDTYQRPELWPRGESVAFSVELSEAQETELRVRAYNTYELRTEAGKR